MADESVNQLGQADKVLMATSGKLEFILGALTSGDLTENAQYGLRSMLCDMKADIERVGAMLHEAQGQH